ncbi:MAG: linear amide C-N hydrolase [Firmicutes bacterium]|nr:linear amide C-N hydrolase [Bacillota bacterium]
MCTSVVYKNFFGRNLDYHHSFNEKVAVVPRNFHFKFKCRGPLKEHFAIVGMATVIDEIPLFFDGINEKGLGMAGLNFVGNAAYFEPRNSKDNITPFEFIPWMLGQCSSVDEARELLGNLNLVNIPFSEQIPLAQLHWIIADEKEAVIVESVASGLKVYDNPVGVLTNNPDFESQMFYLKHSKGMSASLSSRARFARAVHIKRNSLSDGEGDLSQYFHILAGVEQQRGCKSPDTDEDQITIYSSCCDLKKGIYYYRTYDNSQITAIDMHKADLDTDRLTVVPLRYEQNLLHEQL